MLKTHMIKSPKPQIDLNDIRDAMEQQFDFEYVEAEGRTSLRFDDSKGSFWVNANGSVEGLSNFTKAYQTRIMNALDRHVEYLSSTN